MPTNTPMPYSTDDFDSWQAKQKPQQAADPNLAAAQQVSNTADLTGMPSFARLRLQEHVKSKRAPFTANLSVNELLLTRKMGYTPVAQVLGTSVYHVGWQWIPANWFYGATELMTLTQARLEAWRFSLSRLEQQAHAAGTHAVVGVRHDRRAFDNSFRSIEDGEGNPDVIEVSLTGTAVRFENYEAQQERPLLSAMSGQEFIALRATGYYPVGIAYGCCVFYQPSYWSAMTGSSSTVAWGTQWQNQELTDFTNGLIQTRRTAVQRMHDEMMRLGGSGILGAQMHSSIREIERDTGNDQKQVGLIITVESYGTAVVEVDGGVDTAVEAVVVLSDGG